VAALAGSGQGTARDNKFLGKTNRRRQKFKPNQSGLLNSKKALQLTTLCVSLRNYSVISFRMPPLDGAPQLFRTFAW